MSQLGEFRDFLLKEDDIDYKGMVSKYGEVTLVFVIQFRVEVHVLYLAQ